MDEDTTQTEEYFPPEMEKMGPIELADAISDGRRYFPIQITYPESCESFVDSSIGVINQYVKENLTDIAMRPLNFSHARLRGFNAPGIFIPYTIFDYADLRDAVFTGTNLTNTRFVETDASRIDLERARLSGAIFKRAILSESSPWTDLTNVVFDEVVLDGADLTNAKNIDKIRFWSLPSSYNGMVVTPSQADFLESLGLDMNKLRIKGEK